MGRIGRKLRSTMGGCFSVHKKEGEEEVEERSSSFKTRFKGLSPEEQREESAGDISQRKTLGSILNEARETSEYAFCQGSKEEAWFDAEGRFVSDSDDEFMSVCGDLPSAGNSLSLPRSGPTTPRPTFATLKEQMLQAEDTHGAMSPPPGTVNGRTEYIPGNKLHPDEDKKCTISLGRKLDATPRNSSVSVAPVTDGSTELETGKHGSQHSKPEFDGCLPCLLNSVASFDKRSPQRRKSFRLFSFKRRSCDTDLHDMSKILHRPLAGSQVPMSDGSYEGSWSRVSPSSFKLRSRNYMKDKKKQLASEISIFEAAGVDVFLSSKKVDHIARFVDMSAMVDSSHTSSEKFPMLFVFNIQLPLCTASFFPSENSGEGLSLVFYYRLSETFLKEGPPHVKEMLTKLLEDEQEKVKGFVADTVVPFRERLKIVARVINPEEIHLNAAERKLVVSYNEKPVLSRPQHSFYKGSNYFEVDLDVHRFNFIARKAVESFRERLQLCVLDIGLTIQGNKAEELPEYMLCCARINKLNIHGFKYLNCDQDSSVKHLKTA